MQTFNVKKNQSAWSTDVRVTNEQLVILSFIMPFLEQMERAEAIELLRIKYYDYKIIIRRNLSGVFTYNIKIEKL